MEITVLKNVYWVALTVCVVSVVIQQSEGHPSTFDLSYEPEIINRVQSVDNRRPVIGILSQESLTHGESYLYASYVKFIEQAGALVVPIRISEPDEYYVDLFGKLNGVVFPGGSASLLVSGYAHAAQHFYNLSIKAYAEDDYFPILGICLGLEQLTALATGVNPLSSCNGVDYSLALNLTNDAMKSRLFSGMPPHLLNAIKKWNVTYNNHEYCMTTEVFQKTKSLTDFYRVMSTNVAVDGTEFVSSMEAYDFPFYGTQWHPEKNIYLWSSAHVNHSALAVQITQYVADFFVDEARKSKHQYKDVDKLSQALIFNYQPVFEGAPSFHNVYYFDIPDEDNTGDYLLWQWPKLQSHGPHHSMSRLSDYLGFLMVIFISVLIYRSYVARQNRDKHLYSNSKVIEM